MNILVTWQQVVGVVQMPRAAFVSREGEGKASYGTFLQATPERSWDGKGQSLATDDENFR